GGDAHHPAAALARVLRRQPQLFDFAQGAQASVARRASMMEATFGEQASIPDDVDPPFPRLLLLGQQPAEVGLLDDRWRVADSPVLKATPGPYESFGGEQAHLGVIGDGARPAVGRHIVGDSEGAELLPYLRQAQELDAGPQRVADCSSKEATSDPVGWRRF